MDKFSLLNAKSVQIRRQQPLVQSLKVPGAFDYRSVLLVDGRRVARVWRSIDSTARSGITRTVEAVLSSRDPNGPERTYRAIAILGQHNRGDALFLLEKQEKLRAPVRILSPDEKLLATLEPQLGIAPKFAITSDLGNRIGICQPLSRRGIDFDIVDNEGAEIAALRFERLQGRGVLRRGVALIATPDIWNLTYSRAGIDGPTKLILLATAVAITAERALGNSLGAIANASARSAAAAEGSAEATRRALGQAKQARKRALGTKSDGTEPRYPKPLKP